MSRTMGSRLKRKLTLGAAAKAKAKLRKDFRLGSNPAKVEALLRLIEETEKRYPKTKRPKH